MPKHASDSTEQQAAERHLILALATELGVRIRPAIIRTMDAVVNLDGYSLEHHILAEAYAHHGKLRSGHTRKIATDVLKLAFLERSLGGSWRKFLCFAEADACSSLRGKSWLAQTIRSFNFQLCVFALPSSVRAEVLTAQGRQRMGNIGSQERLTTRSGGSSSATRLRS